VKSIDDLLTEFSNNPVNTRRKGYCTTAKWLDKQDPKLKEKLVKTLSDETLGLDIKNFMKALVTNGYELPMKETAFRDHFKGRCTCRK
jgi:hypothetical protein